MRHYGVVRSPGLPRNGIHFARHPCRASQPDLPRRGDARLRALVPRHERDDRRADVPARRAGDGRDVSASGRCRDVGCVDAVLQLLLSASRGTWTIADPQNWVALFVFLAVSLVASRLSHVARARTEEAIGRRDELARLFDLSRDVLVMTASPDAVSHLARAIARRFDLEYVAIALPGSERLVHRYERAMGP